MAAVQAVLTTGTGQAVDWLTLAEGDHILHITWAGSPGDADVTLRPPNGTFRDAYDSAGVVNITANKSVRVAGGCDYSLDVTTHTSAATMVATKCS